MARRRVQETRLNARARQPEKAPAYKDNEPSAYREKRESVSYSRDEYKEKKGRKARTLGSCTPGGSLAVIMAEQGRQLVLLPTCSDAFCRRLTIDLEGMERHRERGKGKVGWRVG